MKESLASNSPKPAQVSSFWQTVQANVQQHRTAPIVAAKRNQPIPLSFAQLRLWQLHQINPHSCANYIPAIVRVQGELNAMALEQSLRELSRRHEILRTKFPMLDGQPVQVICSEDELRLDIVDLCHITELEQAIKQSIRSIQTEPFDLANDLPWRAKLLRLSDRESLLVRCMHHIIYDGWSGTLFKQELKTLYAAFSTGKSSPLPPLPIQYADYTVWQRQTLTEQALHPLRQHWEQQLSAPIAPLELPFDRPRLSATTELGAIQCLTLSQELTQALKLLSRQEGVSLFVTLLTAFKVLLFSYSQQTDLLICSPFADRQRLELKKLIGYFNHILLLRTNLSGNPSCRILLQRVSQVVLEAQANADFPLQAIAELPAMARIPLNRVLFALQNLPPQAFELPGLTVEPVVHEPPGVDFDLSVSIQEQQNQLVVTFTYNPALFESDTIAAMRDNFQTLLDRIVENPEQCLEDLTLNLIVRCDRGSSVHSNSAPVWLVSELEGWLFGSQTIAQEMIAQLWNEVLGLNYPENGRIPLSIFVSFFELGGHSLAVAQLIQRIEEVFQVQLSLQQLLDHPTIGQLSDCIDAQKQQERISVSQSPFLIPLQTHGTKTPVFFVPTIAGHEWVLTFRANLFCRLGQDQPLYALCNQKTNGEGWLQEGFHPTVEALAADYVKAIQSVQSQPPYVIMSECIGNAIALEVAQQLMAQNQFVARLIVLDADLRWGKSFSATAPSAETIAQAIEAARSRSHQEWGEFHDIVQFHYAALIANYQPQPYAGRITLIAAAEGTITEDATLGWATYAQGGLEVCIVPGDHTSYLGLSIDTTVGQIKACLDQINTEITTGTQAASSTYTTVMSQASLPKLQSWNFLSAQTNWNNASEAERLEKLYQQALEVQPHRVDLQIRRGELARQQGNWNLAINCFHKAIAIDPNCSKARNLLKDTLYCSGFWSRDISLVENLGIQVKRNFARMKRKLTSAI